MAAAEAEEPLSEPGASEAGDCAESLAKRVQSRYDAVEAYGASFEQVTHSISLGGGALADEEPSRGSVLLAKPGRMRWHYRSPRESLTVSDGDVLWLFDPEAREASRYPVAESQLTGAALQFLMGEGRILEHFDVSAKSCRPGDDGGIDLELVPRESASYERMILRAHATRGEVMATTLVDLFGNRTTLTFSELRFDPPIEADAFDFQPPEGVQVIDLLDPS